jgi:hypothetical protein
MAISIIGSIVLGAFLGQFCRVFVLLPIMAVVLASELGNACYFGLGFGHSLCEFALISTSSNRFFRNSRLLHRFKVATARKVAAQASAFRVRGHCRDVAPLDTA